MIFPDGAFSVELGCSLQFGIEKCATNQHSKYSPSWSAPPILFKKCYRYLWVCRQSSRACKSGEKPSTEA